MDVYDFRNDDDEAGITHNELKWTRIRYFMLGGLCMFVILWFIGLALGL